MLPVRLVQLLAVVGDRIDGRVAIVDVGLTAWRVRDIVGTVRADVVIVIVVGVICAS